jgi:hypothetical protein
MSISAASIAVAERFDLVRQRYECHDHQHASAVLCVDFPDLFGEICEALLAFRVTEEQIRAPGGNESQIPKHFASLLRHVGWREQQLTARLVVDEETVSTDTHKVDFVKGKVAVEMEWNSKDQTFDRDLFAFRAFFEYHRIAAAVLVTRSDDLNEYFKRLGSYTDKHGVERHYKSKYGASTTHMSKLLPRLRAGRSGGCPVLAVGITRQQIDPQNG